MSITLLRTLVAIADTGSFRGAADKVCVTQAAVGQQMQRLEDQFDVVLFDRSGRVPKLNTLGFTTVSKAREVVQNYDMLLEGITDDGHLVGELTVGAIPSLLTALVPLSIKRLMGSYPDLHTRVVPGLSEDLLEQVERGSVDAAIISEPAHVLSGLNWQPFASEEFVLITAADVAQSDPIKLLNEMPYIRHQRHTAAGVIADAWLSKNKIKVRPTMELQSLETVCSMVSHNLGVSVVPNVCVPDVVFQSLRKIPLKQFPTHRVLGVLTRSETAKARLVTALLAEIKATIALV